MLGFVQVPKHGCAVFAAGGAERPVRGDGYGIDIASVANVISLDAAGCKLPYLSGRLNVSPLMQRN